MTDMTAKKESNGTKIWILNVLAFVSVGSIIGAAITYGVMQNRIDSLDRQVAINTPRITELEKAVSKFDLFMAENNKAHDRIEKGLERLYNKQVSLKSEPDFRP
jgi:hypothetical protein